MFRKYIKKLLEIVSVYYVVDEALDVERNLNNYTIEPSTTLDPDMEIDEYLLIQKFEASSIEKQNCTKNEKISAARLLFIVSLLIFISC